MEEVKETIKKFVTLISYIIVADLVFAFLILIMINFNPVTFFILIDQYIKIILSSWPAVILMLGIVLLSSQQEAISEFITKRLVSAGIDGIKGAMPSQESVLENQDKADESLEENHKNEVIKKSDESYSTQSNKAEVDYKTLYTLERIFSVIFGSQIKLFEKLRLAGESGLSYQEIAADFEKTKLESWGHMKEKWSLEKYLAFPLSENLIEKVDKDGSRYKISIFGIKFLDHLTQNNYQMFRPL